MSRADVLRLAAPVLRTPKGPRIRPGGFSEYFGPDGSVVEVYSSTCHHCQHITDFPSRKKMMEYVEICRGCMKLICLECIGKPCRPFEKEAERQEKEARLQRRIEQGKWGCYEV